MYKAPASPVERGSLMAAFGCNFEGDIPPQRVVELVGQICSTSPREHDMTC